jgi:hypothetical protein
MPSSSCSTTLRRLLAQIKGTSGGVTTVPVAGAAPGREVASADKNPEVGVKIGSVSAWRRNVNGRSAVGKRRKRNGSARSKTRREATVRL